MEKHPLKHSRLLIGIALTVWSCLFITIALISIPSYWPGFSARAADWLRGLVGDAAVACLAFLTPLRLIPLSSSIRNRLHKPLVN